MSWSTEMTPRSLKRGMRDETTVVVIQAALLLFLSVLSLPGASLNLRLMHFS